MAAPTLNSNVTRAIAQTAQYIQENNSPGLFRRETPVSMVGVKPRTFTSWMSK